MPRAAKHPIDNLAEIKALAGVFILSSEGDAKRGYAEFEHGGVRIYRRWGMMRDNITQVAFEIKSRTDDVVRDPRVWSDGMATVDERVRDQEFRNTVANVKTVQLANERAKAGTPKPTRKKSRAA